MRRNEPLKNAKIKIKEFKKELKAVIGKSNKLKVADLEYYIKKKYNSDFFNSLEELYEKCHSKIILKDDLKNYIDCLGYDVIAKKYRVAEITKCIDGKTKSAKVYFNYDGDTITYVYLEGDGIDKLGMLKILEKGGEKKIKKTLKRWYGMSDKKLERLVDKLF